MNEEKIVRLGIIVPCYNEEEVLQEIAKQLVDFLRSMAEEEKISSESKVYFVDDGSIDNTWKIIEKLADRHQEIKGIKLSKNRGHQNALLAGLLTAEGDVLVSIDADLQDDISAIEKMVYKYQQGSEIVYGVRSQRETDTFFKKWTAHIFYKIMLLMGADVVYNHADYRLMSRKAIDALKDYKEVNLFLRGIIRLIGYKSSTIYYERAERFAGESKYPLRKMLAFAWDGITSFSTVPLRFITVLGFMTFFVTLLMSIWILSIKLFTGRAVPGWASTVLPIYFLGGLQIFSIGVIGEYLGKVYDETKARPRFNIEKVV